MAPQKLVYKRINNWQQLVGIYKFCLLQDKQTHLYINKMPFCSIDDVPDRVTNLKNLLDQGEKLEIATGAGRLAS